MRARWIRLATPAVLLAGCGGPQNFLEAAGPAAARLATLGWIAIIAFSVTTVVVWCLLAWVATRRRGSYAQHVSAQARGGQRWIVWGGVVVPVLVLGGLFVYTLWTLSTYPIAHVHAGGDGRPSGHIEPDIRIVGHQWWFEAVYLPGGGLCTADVDALGRRDRAAQDMSRIVNSPTEVHIPVGVPVDIELVTRDVIHSFWIPKLHGKVDMVPGLRNRIRLLADRPGIYEGQCAEYCGVQHAHMRLLVVAQTPAEYVRWLAQHQRDPAPSADAQVLRGRDVFMRSACATCHTIRGTPAHASVGPDLSFIGARRRIAGGMLENNTANLQAWVTDAQSLKPGSQMPSFREFTGPELRALVGYLQSLK